MKLLLIKGLPFTPLLTVILFVSSLYFTRTIIEPVKNLLDTIKEIAGGRFDLRVIHLSKDEIGGFAISIDNTAGGSEVIKTNSPKG